MLVSVATFIGGLYFFLEFLLPKEFLGFSFAPYHEYITNGFITVGVTAIGLGVISILRVHGSRVIRVNNGWVPSLLLLASMCAMLIVTVTEWNRDYSDSKQVERALLLKDFTKIIQADAASGAFVKVPTSERMRIAYQAIAELEIDLSTLPTTTSSASADLKNARQTLNELVSHTPALENLTAVGDALVQVGTTLGVVNSEIRAASVNRTAYRLLYDGLWTALASAMFSLLGFYIAAAAFRAFRVRSVESALMMAAAVVVMLGQIPFGVWLYEGLPAMRGWLLSIPSAAAFRAIRLGSGIAALLMAIRMWLSLDRKGKGV